MCPTVKKASVQGAQKIIFQPEGSAGKYVEKGANLPKQSPTQFSQVQRPSCCCHNFVTRHKHSFNTSQLSWKSICNWWEIFYLFLGQRSKVVEGGALSLIIPFCHVIISQPGDTSLSRGSFSIICNLSLKLDSIRLSHPSCYQHWTLKSTSEFLHI